jgi:DNA repair exonuclease SbcCD ATPase subunit
MLEIERISWRNFLAYGDYTTTLELPELGQCLITGEVVEDDEKETYDASSLGQKKKSNGAGKSTIPSVIQWALFGRTMHSANPGDSVINWFTGKDCWAKIDFKNGDSITRTRNMSGENELLFVRNGSEEKLLSNTLATAKLQQAELSRYFGLDWDIFCGSAFFTQYGRSWMEMADQPRKKALERLLRTDRFNYYGRISKARCDHYDMEVQKQSSKRDSVKREKERLESQLTRAKSQESLYDAQREQRRLEMLAEAENEIRERDKIELPVLDKLEAKWQVVKQIEGLIGVKQKEAAKILREAQAFDNAISKAESNVRALEGRIKLWREKNGQICVSCEQEVVAEHVESRIEPLEVQVVSEREKLTSLRSQKAEKIAAATALQTEIDKMDDLLEAKKPQLTMEDARRIHDRWQQRNREAERLKIAAERILNEPNPHTEMISEAEQGIAQCETELVVIEREIERYESLNRHCAYIGNAYTDRRKIKSFVFAEHVPFINSRLNHYLDVFGLDVKIELTESLGVTSNFWSYDFQSGGERKRTDVAFMLAAFDFHEQVYGRQCNILVLDEVDGRLDDDGIDSLINIIKNELANRVETILIVSHRDLMKDVFSREIKVTRNSRFSTLEVI